MNVFNYVPGMNSNHPQYQPPPTFLTNSLSRRQVEFSKEIISKTGKNPAGFSDLSGNNYLFVNDKDGFRIVADTTSRK
jgi:hypothetical protein